MCDKCKNGQSVSEAWKNKLLETNGMPSRVFELDQPDPPATPPPALEASGPACAACGKRQPHSGAFCCYCGAALPSEPEQQPQPEGPATCPVCGQAAQPGERFCGLCGSKLGL